MEWEELLIKVIRFIDTCSLILIVVSVLLLLWVTSWDNRWLAIKLILTGVSLMVFIYFLAEKN